MSDQRVDGYVCGMATVLFCPVTFNLAETTRMIQVARALDTAHTPVFMGYEHDFVDLIRDAGFDYRPCEPAWTDRERDQAMAFDQGRTVRSPFTKDLVAARVAVEREMIRELDARAVVTGSNLTSFLSARADHVQLFFPVPFALTQAQVSQTGRMRFTTGLPLMKMTAVLEKYDCARFGARRPEPSEPRTASGPTS